MTPQRKKTANRSKTQGKPSPQQRPSAPHLIIHRLELLPEGKRLSESVADHFGMTQIAALSWLVEWFSGQSEDVQQAILGHAPSEGDVTRKVLSRMAARK